MKKTAFIIKVTSLLVLVSMMAVLAGCSKTAVTPDDFKTLAEEKGYQVVDAADQFADYDYVTQALIAVAQDKYQVEFYQLSDSSYAQSFYESNKSKFELNKSGTYTDSSVSGKNYAKFTLNSDGKFMLIEYVGTTAVYVDADAQYKSEIEAFLKELKY